MSTEGDGFPRRQLFILALCRICEPIAFMSVFPYVYYMIQSFHVTNDERQISFYAGVVTSSFALAEFSTSMLWGKLSDQIGRKPVLIFGLFGTMISMLIFGFASSLPIAVLGRALGGFLNGNIGVLQTTLAEIVTVKEHQPRAYSIMPFVWCLGSILGPALGGALAQPSRNYPAFFAPGSFFDRHPFALPNLVCSGILVVGMLVGILFLEETHDEKKQRRDLGLRAGRWILRHLLGPEASDAADEMGAMNPWEQFSLLEDDPPGYCSNEGTPPNQSRSPSPGAGRPDGPRPRAKSPGLGAAKAFTKNVILAIIGYGIVAFISFDTLVPILLSTPVTHAASSAPFHFTGGFGWSTKTIGLMLTIQGAYSMGAQLILFPYAVRRFGELRTFRAVLVSFPLLYCITPFTVRLPAHLQQPAVYACLLWKITAHVMAFPSITLLITNSAPSMLVLGTVNGAAASTASLSRAFGPTVSGLLQTWGNRLGVGGLAFWVCGLVSILGALESFWMREGDGRMTPLPARGGLDPTPPDAHEIEAVLETVEITDDKRGFHAVLDPSGPAPRKLEASG